MQLVLNPDLLLKFKFEWPWNSNIDKIEEINKIVSNLIRIESKSDDLELLSLSMWSNSLK
jgi:hypothetical protein